jgi:hypothetical protein
MKSPFVFLLLLALLSPACSAEDYKSASPATTTLKDGAPTTNPGAPATEQVVAQRAVASTRASHAYDLRVSQATSIPQENVSLADVDRTRAIREAADRKIIRNADLTLEVDSTTESQHRITSIAEAHGGFVVTSEAKQREHPDPSRRTLDIKLVVRIPSERFGVALDEIKRLAGNLPAENITGQDVTEDYIDLDARVRTQKALELQFLEIMKQAKGVETALEVQRQIADVRTEIERLEGRKRFLENRASLSTITVNLQTPKVIAVSPSTIGHPIRDAVSDSLELASGMLIFFVRFVILMVPVFIFILLPSGLVLRYLVRRVKRVRFEETLATPDPQ